jgi:hypothetical protein
LDFTSVVAAPTQQIAFKRRMIMRKRSAVSSVLVAVAAVMLWGAGGTAFAEETCESITASADGTQFQMHEGKADADTHPCGAYQFCIFAVLEGNLGTLDYSYFSNWSWAIVQPGLPFGAHYSWGDTIIAMGEGNEVHGRERVVVVGDNFVSLIEISGGTGVYEGASGVLFAPGGGTSVTEEGFEVFGEICTP